MITKRGKTSHWLYIIASGEAEIVQDRPDGSRLRLLATRPQIAEDISRIVAARKHDNEATNAAAAMAEGRTNPIDLLARIRRFFGLGA